MTQMKQKITKPELDDHTAAIERSLIRAGQEARRVAIFYGTPIFIWRDGRVVALDPKTDEEIPNYTATREADGISAHKSGTRKSGIPGQKK